MHRLATARGSVDVYCLAVPGAARLRETMPGMMAALGCVPRLSIDRGGGDTQRIGRRSAQARIASSHVRAMREYLADEAAGPFLLLLEDDCVFAEADAGARVAEFVEALERRWPRWRTVHVGHVGLGPLVPSHVHPRLCFSAVPMTAHAVLYKGGRALAALLRRRGGFRGRRPLFLEGNLSVSPWAKLAVWPTLATQAVPAKEYRALFRSRARPDNFYFALDAFTLAAAALAWCLAAALAAAFLRRLAHT